MNLFIDKSILDSIIPVVKVWRPAFNQTTTRIPMTNVRGQLKTGQLFLFINDHRLINDFTKNFQIWINMPCQVLQHSTWYSVWSKVYHLSLWIDEVIHDFICIRMFIRQSSRITISITDIEWFPQVYTVQSNIPGAKLQVRSTYGAWFGRWDKPYKSGHLRRWSKRAARSCGWETSRGRYPNSTRFKTFQTSCS